MENKWSRIVEVAEEGIKKGIYPGFCLGVAEGEKIKFQAGRGYRKIEPERGIMEENNLFDLASLTKPIATASTALKMIEEGYFSLDESIGSYLPEKYRHRWGRVSFRHLLSHTSGIPAWYPTYTRVSSRKEVLYVLLQMEQVYRPGSKSEYSCLGYILLGFLLEKIGGASLDQISRELVFKPLGLDKTCFNPVEKGFGEEAFVYNERDSKIERGMVARAGLSFSDWREGFSPGVVNDGNSAYSLEGISGNAGLFSTVSDVILFGQAWLKSLKGEGFLARSLASLAVKEQGRDLDDFGLGWVLLRSKLRETTFSSSMAPFLPTPLYSEVGPSAAGELFSPESFGHTGFTGTSLFIDPYYSRVIVFMANHLHPAFNGGLNTIRARIHNTVFSFLDKESS